MFRALLDRFGRQAPTYAVPASSRVYAVGDIHGRADLLRMIHRKIAADAEASSVERRVIVYLGDFIDRGEASKEVIDILLDEKLPGFEAIHLMGNHEDIMLEFLEDMTAGPNWFLNGGDATLFSYGVGNPVGAERDERWRVLQEALRRNLPQRHVDFLKSLRLGHVEGDYMFVHAGIRPGRGLEEQAREDLLWIRDDFLSSRADHGKCVVHGHTIAPAVAVRRNRIGIDTGAYYSGTLTCLVLEGSDRRLLQT